MKAQKKLDKILDACCRLVEEEVGALMGVSFKMSHTFNKLAGKEEYFDEQDDKKVVAKIDLTGEIEGKGGLVIGLKDAIRLGGTLIMLPQAELEEVVKSGNYTEEIEDSYGEIANIVAGAFTKVFEEMYPQSCRFVRKEQSVVSPLKVEVDSDEPVIDQWYYWVKAAMSVEEHEMGDLDMLIPAEQLGLEIPQQEGAAAGSAAEEDDVRSQEKVAVDQAEPSGPESPEETEEPEPVRADTEPEAAAPQPSGQAARQRPEPPQLSSDELKKQKKRIDKILKNAASLVSSEVGALLGVDVTLSAPAHSFVSKEDFLLENVSGRQMLANMDVVEESEGACYLFLNLKDAIRLGSILIMLPANELETAVNEEEVSADTEDAYGEVANIISGVYTQVFQEQYSKNIRFIKTGLEIVQPLKVDTETDEVIPNEQYYLSRSRLSVGDRQCGDVCMLLPVDLFQLRGEEGQGEADAGQVEEPAESSVKQSVPEGTVAASGKTPAESARQSAAEVVIVENDHEEAEKLSTELQALGLSTNTLSFSDSISRHISPAVRLIIIAMKEVDEHAYSVIIKVNTQTSAPIVAAGPEWTRSKVIKAVKYGVQDILLTPAAKDDIREKVQNNIMRLAA